MKDIKIKFNGANSIIDLTSQVEDKELYAQKALLNIATEAGSDPLYPDRGTDLLKSAIYGYAVSGNSAAHLGNIAAINTLFFIRSQEYAAQAESPHLIKNIKLLIHTYVMSSQSLNFDAAFVFADNTASVDKLTLTATIQ